MKAPGKSIKLHPGAFSGPPYEEGALSDAAVQTEYHKDMKGNDLSAEIVPHLALVAEGALMFIDEKLDKQFQKYMDRGRYADAIRLWHISQPMAAAVWKVTWHMSYQLDIITFLGPKEFAKALEEWLAEQELPVNNGRHVCFLQAPDGAQMELIEKV